MKRVVKISVLFGLIIGCIVMSNAAHHHVQTNPLITIDQLLSPCVHIHITDMLYALANQSPTIIARTIHQKFPCIKAVAIEHTAQGTVSFVVTANSPQYAVNDSLLVLENGHLVDRHLYNEGLIVGIQSVTVAENQLHRLPHNFKAILENIFAQPRLYGISWISEHEIVLHDETIPQLHVLCCAARLPDTQCMAHYTTMYQNFKQETEALHSKKKVPRLNGLVADIRFKNQIIFRGYVGGSYG